MKKFIAVLIAAVMAFSLVPVTAFAANGPMPVTPDNPPLFGYASIRINEWVDEEHDNYYIIFDAYSEERKIPEGVSYNLSTNTLSVTDVDMPAAAIYINMMGDDFKLKVTGTCNFRGIDVINYGYNTSVTITGTGTLNLNADKKGDTPYYVYNGGENQFLNIDKSVTVNMYAQSEEGPAFVANYLENDDKDTVFTEDGKPVAAGLTGKEETYVAADREDIAYVDDPDVEWHHNKKVICKADPDGLYSAYWSDYSEEPGYSVTHYINIPELDVYAEDPDFRWETFSEEEFDEQFEFALKDQPVTIGYFDEWKWEHRGSEGILVKKSGDPDGIYAAVQQWDDKYKISKYHWDNEKEIYVADSDSDYVKLTEDEFEANGYTVVTEDVQEHVMVNCWDMPPDSSDRNMRELEAITRESDPDSEYVMTATYRSSKAQGEETGVIVQKVHYTSGDDPEAFVKLYDRNQESEYYDPEEEYEWWIKDEDFASEDCDFKYKMKTVTQEVTLRCAPADYEIADDTMKSNLWEKGDEKYVVYNWYREGHEDDLHYTLHHLVFDEEKGFYFVDTVNTDDDITLEEIAARGIVQKFEPKPYDLTTMGTFVNASYDIYKDDDGNIYFANWKKVPFVKTGETLEYGGRTYSIVTQAEGVDFDKLHDTFHTVYTGAYNYTLNANEYHHVGDGTEPEPVYSGKTGECDWRYDPATFTLTISGNGETGGYDEENPAPWSEFTVKNVDIKDGVKGIRSCNFNGTDIESVTIPDSVEHIGMITFRDCKKLREVKLSKNLKSIAGGAFNGCSALEKIDIPDKVESIGPFAFGGCSNLAEIDVPDSLYNVGAGVAENTKWFNDQPNGPVYFGKVFYGYHGGVPKDTVLTIEEGTVAIAAGCMSDASQKENLIAVVFPSTMTRIYAANLFWGCSGLKEAEIPAEVTEIMDKALGYCFDEEVGELVKVKDYTIVGVKGSEAERYAKDNGFAFRTKGGYILGDADGDGVITVMDVTAVQKHIAEINILTGDRFLAADVNRDGVVDISDATLIQKYVADIIDEF